MIVIRKLHLDAMFWQTSTVCLNQDVEVARRQRQVEDIRWRTQGEYGDLQLQGNQTGEDIVILSGVK